MEEKEKKSMDVKISFSDLQIETTEPVTGSGKAHLVDVRARNGGGNCRQDP
jgi:hypothetical protein